MTTVWLPCILWRKQILAGKVESLDPSRKATVFDFRGFKWMKVHSNGLFFRLFYVAPCVLLGVAPCDEPFLSPCQPWHWNSTTSRSGISVGVLGGFHLSTEAIRPFVHCVFNMNHKQHYSKRQFLPCILYKLYNIVDFVFWILNGDGSWRWLDHCPFRWFPPGYFLWLFAFNPTHAAAPARSRQRDEGWPVEGFHDWPEDVRPQCCVKFI